MTFKCLVDCLLDIRCHAKRPADCDGLTEVSNIVLETCYEDSAELGKECLANGGILAERMKSTDNQRAFPLTEVDNHGHIGKTTILVEWSTYSHRTERDSHD